MGTDGKDRLRAYAGSVNLHGVKATAVIEEVEEYPEYVRATFEVDPPPRGVDKEVYSCLVKREPTFAERVAQREAQT